MLFEGLLPHESTFQPSAGNLHGLPSIQALGECMYMYDIHVGDVVQVVQ